MKRIPLFLLVLTFAIFLFFYPVFLSQKIPFPGDILVGYAPWSSYSYSGYTQGGVPNKAQGIDVVRQLYPWKKLAIDEWRKGVVPLWNPYSFSGTPLLANYQSAVFYPFNLVFLLPFNVGWTVFIILQPVLGFLFMYLYLRQLKLPKSACILGSVSFAFSLYLTVWLEWGNIGHTFIWLPLLLFIIEKLVDKFNLKWLLIFSLAYSFCILAGYMQQVIYISILFFSYFIYRARSQKFFYKKILEFSFFIFLSYLITAVQLLPAIELFRQSARSIYGGEVLRQILAPWYYLVTILIPDFFGNPAYRNYFIEGTYIERVLYIGVVPLFFVLNATRKNPVVRFFIATAMMAVILGLYNPISQTIYGLKIPIIGTTYPTRIFSLIAFSFSVMSAYGFSVFLDAKTKFNKKILMIPLLTISLWLTVLLLSLTGCFGESFPVVIKNLILSSFIVMLTTGLIIFAQRYIKFKRIIIPVLIILLVFDLFIFFSRITPFSSGDFIYPKTEIIENLKQTNTDYSRFWAYGTAFIESNLSTYEHLFSTDGYDPLFIKRYGEFIATSGDGKLKTNIPRSDALLFRGFGKDDLKNNKYRKRAMDLTSIKYILHKNESGNGEHDSTFPSEEYNLTGQRGTWQIYENKNAVPRVLATDDFIVEQDSGKIIKILYDDNFNPNKTIILEKNPDVKFNTHTTTNGAILKITYYENNEVTIDAKLVSPKIILLTDNYYPGWNAYVDGKKQPIFRANYTFRAVPVGSGEHTVIFKYEPLMFEAGRMTSILSLVIIIFICGPLFATKKYDQELVV